VGVTDQDGPDNQVDTPRLHFLYSQRESAANLPTMIGEGPNK